MSAPVITTLLTPNPASGSQTATISTEHTLASASSAGGVYLLRVNCVNMVDGDVVELRAYTKASGSDSEAVCYLASFANTQSDVIKLSIPVATAEDIKFTLKQTAGTGRAFPWGVLNLSGA